MAGPLEGVRVVEVATHVYVPISGAVLADYGADVIRIEDPNAPDPMRAITIGRLDASRTARSGFQPANRGKRSVAIDLKNPEGRSVLSRVLATADVFVTSLRPDAVARRRLDLASVRADNPVIIYVRGSAFGSRGQDAGRGGYDAGAYWARSGMQQILTPPSAEWPLNPRPAYGDVVGGLHMAGAIGIALYRRSVTGEASVLDTSLLASGMWQVQMDLTKAYAADAAGTPAGPPHFERYEMPNPLMMAYRTADGEYIYLQLLSPDRYWPELCEILEQPGMAGDPRFADIESRASNARECIEWLETVFAQRTLDEWQRILSDFRGEWVRSSPPSDLRHDPQVEANEYFIEVDLGDGSKAPIVAPPVQFDGGPPRPTRGPEHGEHTEAVLLEVGYTWDDIGALKDRQVVL
jgi:crotonobetainyl-CoA:carnitine CoA-transferase CaiB-like acyl-CoA transferase